jgi:NADH pyrophosphatase NudC (nudix superfamily)
MAKKKGEYAYICPQCGAHFFPVATSKLVARVKVGTRAKATTKKKPAKKGQE